MILHPSLASADPLRYAEALTALHDAPLGSLHLDIEDTSFINNITFPFRQSHNTLAIRSHFT